MRIAIFGRSHELWPVATLLAQQLPSPFSLTLVEDASAVAVPSALGLPCDSEFHAAIGLSPQDLVTQCNGTLGLGIDFRDWRGEGSRFFLASSGSPPAIGGVALHHIMLRAAYIYEEPRRLEYLLQPFRFAMRAAEAGKLAEPPDDPDSPLTLLGPNVQCDRAAYSDLLHERFPMDRARLERGAGSTLDIESGVIRSVRLEDGSEIDADLFIDVSGRLAQLAPAEWDADPQSFSDILAFDRQLSSQSDEPLGDRGGRPDARALPGGLLVTTPLQRGAVVELLFSSRHMDEARAAELAGNRAGAVGFAAHLCERPWTGNLLRLGSASAAFGPLLSADMRLLHEQALLLARHIPAAADMQVEAAEFNAKQAQVARQLRDFVAALFFLNARDDEPWSAIRDTAPPGSLDTRLVQFRSRGRFVTFDKELFDRQTWIDLMIGFGIVPERYDPLVGAMDMRRIAPILKRMTDDFGRVIAAMPDRADFLQSYVSRDR